MRAGEDINKVSTCVVYSFRSPQKVVHFSTLRRHQDVFLLPTFDRWHRKSLWSQMFDHREELLLIFDLSLMFALYGLKRRKEKESGAVSYSIVGVREAIAGQQEFPQGVGR